VRSKNKRSPTAAERAHIEKVARLPCVVCGSYGDSDGCEVHEPEQGMWWISIPLCPACHRGPDGWHGTRLLWSLHKMTELKAINETVRQIA
jgi:hypothetical protein